MRPLGDLVRDAVCLVDELGSVRSRVENLLEGLRGPVPEEATTSVESAPSSSGALAELDAVLCAARDRLGEIARSVGELEELVYHSDREPGQLIPLPAPTMEDLTRAQREKNRIARDRPESRPEAFYNLDAVRARSEGPEPDEEDATPRRRASDRAQRGH